VNAPKGAFCLQNYTKTVKGNTLCNVMCNQNPNHHTKKEWKSKSKSCFENEFEIKKFSQKFSQIQNPQSFILLSQHSKIHPFST